MAKATAENSHLDFLEFVESDGTIISSAQSPAKFGHLESDVRSFAEVADQAAFLKQEELQDRTELGLFAVRATHGEHPVYAIGGRRLDKDFLSALDLPAGMRALLYQNRGDHFSPDWLIDPAGSVADEKHSLSKLQPVVDAVRKYGQEMNAVVAWSQDRADDEVFHAIPLRGAGTGNDRPLLAILLIGNSRRTYVELKRHIRSAAPAGGWRRNRARHPSQQLGSGAGNSSGGALGARGAGSGGGKLECARGCFGQRRTGTTGRFFQSNDD